MSESSEKPKKRSRCKQSLYFNEELIVELEREAARLDRPLSWVMQQAWRIARDQIKQFPTSEKL